MNPYINKIRTIAKPNKYTNWYISICENAILRATHITSASRRLRKTAMNIETDIYHEDHHIVPKFYHYDNNINNMAILSAREHFICHMLLTKMFSGGLCSKANLASWRLMHHNNKRKLNSKMYESLKIQISKDATTRFKGKPRSKETKQKISQTRKKSNECKMSSIKNLQLAQERAKISNTGKSRNEHSDFMTSFHSTQPKPIYITPWGNFHPKDIPNKFGWDFIRSFCISNNNKPIIKRQITITNKKLKLLGDILLSYDWVGRTPLEIGFSYVPKPLPNNIA